MSGFTAYLPAPGHRAGAAALAPARAWCEGEQRLPVVGEAHEGASVVAFGRRRGEGAGFFADVDGWLATAGDWFHPEAEPGDARALLALLRARGSGVFDALDGSFAAAWYEASGARLTVALEPIGRAHLFLAVEPRGSFVGASATALACVTNPAPDPLAVHEFLATGTMYADRTPFLAVRRLEAGTRYVFERGRPARTERAATFRAGRGTPESVLDAGVAAVRAARLGLLRPLADLTGGLDSRLVTGLLLAAGVAPDVTVTGSDRDPDVRVARRLAAALGLSLLEERAEPGGGPGSFLDRVLDAAALAEGRCDAVEYARIAAIHDRHARTHGCSVNGSGGELLRSYWWSRRHLRPGATADVRAAARRFVAAACAPPFLAGPAIADLGAHFEGVVESSFARAPERSATALLDHLYLDVRMQCWQGALASATNRIWPSLAPLLARSVVAEALAVPPSARLGRRLFVELFARLAPPLRNCPLESGLPPGALGWRNAWRHAPALVRGAAARAQRAFRRIARRPPPPPPPPPPDETAASQVAAYLAPRELALAPLVDPVRFETWLRGATRGAGAPPELLGRTLALERVLRAAARGARRPLPV
jgi:hypothetical protein